MVRMLALIVFLAALVPVVATAQTPVASPAAACGSVETYRIDMQAAKYGATPAQTEAWHAIGIATYADLAATRPDVLTTAASFMDGYVEAIDGLATVPAALAGLHDLYIDRTVLLTHLLRADADGDVIAALGYESYLDDNTQDVTDEVANIVAMCGAQWWDATAPMLETVYWVMPAGWSDPTG